MSYKLPDSFVDDPPEVNIYKIRSYPPFKLAEPCRVILCGEG